MHETDRQENQWHNVSSLDDPGEGEEEEEGDVYLTLLAASPQTRAVDKASPESGKCVDTVANDGPLFLLLQSSTVAPSHESHSPTHKPSTVTPTQHSPTHKPDSQEEFPSATHQKKPSWGRSVVSVCSRLPPYLPLLLPLLSLLVYQPPFPLSLLLHHTL